MRVLPRGFALIHNLKRNKYRSVFRVLFWIALIFSYILAIVPQEVAPQIGSLSDKGLHFLAFCILVLLLKSAYAIKWFQTFIVLIFYGVFIEISQLFTVNRSAEVLDVVADIIGIGLGLLIYFLLLRLTDAHR
ncbi:VanZ family protein [Sulfurovum sp.]|uniref:VanZ family protein n=1 Tax=Sulfurovum sp. TaxID=1969726 RepID=UPI00345DCEC8